MIKQYAKRPVIVEAVLFDGENSGDIFPWVHASGYKAEDGREFTYHPHDKCMSIPTLEGVMIASPGDYIIKGVAGEFYPCKPDIFKATYDEVGN